MNRLRTFILRILPTPLRRAILPYYHLLLAWLGSVWHRHPSRSLVIIGVTGTKGKSTVTELLARILEADGKKVASSSTIQFKYGERTERNLHKMTMPGRFFMQKFLRTAVEEGCTHAVIEMTSEGARYNRHRFIDIDALVFTNLTPEHIESHGSFANYKTAKLSLAEAVERSPKRPRYLVANIDDQHGADFLNFSVENKLPFSLKDLSLYSIHKDSISLVFGDTTLRVPLVGKFNVYNVLAAVTLARALGISMHTIDQALRSITNIKGRVERFFSDPQAEKQITAVVDYAHTPDSLSQLYEAFRDQPKVCVLGNTGGGRDSWKRPEMAEIAEQHCDRIILTNEDPYDEDPEKIVSDMAEAIHDTDKLSIIMDRRQAIETAVSEAPHGSVVLVSGKGTDPYIMGPDGSKQPWSDAKEVQTALAKIPKRAPSTEDTETTDQSD